MISLAERTELTAKADVLDHGSVRIVDWMGNDLSIARSARVSFDADWRAGDASDAKLIKYLLMNGHSTPFESVEVQFEIKAPIFVVRQWHRHRTQSYNEVSARYTELPEEFYVPTVEVIGKQSANNKQARDMIAEISDDERRAREEEIQWVQEHAHKGFTLYHALLERGWPRELARSVLGLGTYTRFFAKANLINWMRFMKERSHGHAQYEIRVYSDAIRDMLRVIAPVAMQVFEEKYAGRFE